MSETWRVWRHKQNPEIRYYVEMEPVVAVRVEKDNARTRRVVGTYGPKEYPGLPDPGQPACYAHGLVRLKSTRNVAFDDSDYALHLAPEAGLWPREAFEALYEPKEEGVA